MTVHVQTGNMLDVVVEGKSIGLKQRDSDHRKYEVIWLPDPEAVATTLLAEVRRLEPATTTPPAEVLVSRDQVLKIVARIACPSSYCVCSVMIADQVRALPPHGTKEE